jgi:putative endonuclease
LGVAATLYFELHEDMVSAITREKQLKKWNRAWKIRLIEQENPTWRDLYESIV